MCDEEDDKIQTEQTYDIEDEVQDWKFLQTTSSKSTSSAIPKRGEKEFEPDGTTVQTSALDESQRAMFGALSNSRGHHVKNKLLGVWIPGDGDSGYCLITAVRGNYFRDLGKAMSIGGVNAMTLNSLETTYLAERGSLIVYLANDEYRDWIHGEKDNEKDFDVETRLVALDLECLYCLLDVPLAKYQVYAYLKRLGYVLQDHTSPPPPPPTQPDQERKNTTGLFSMWPRQWGILAYPIHHTLHFQTRHYFNYTEVYKSIRLNTSPIPAPPPPPPPPPPGTPPSDLHITFNVWKPMQNFSKKSPPPPDFQLCVVDASKSTQFLTLPQIQRLHGELTPKTSKVVPKLTAKKESRKMESKREIRAKKYAERQASLDVSVQLRNEYLRTRDELFKNGVDPVVIAVANNGILNFLTLSRGQFNDILYNERLGEIYPDRLHSIIYTN
ncbi:tRNA-splicing endonuclease subunit SEN54 [Candida viswanathii]|uniref:tRNA-splicing endonuclease subunit SEN54 n=1 Tax=Candida viswanathii TaxID=5486 RepID=A0A367XXC6_9ASCO|nr:tRNA-splicing endonuclease subunit SEN54 [Candida viswanathii]